MDKTDSLDGFLVWIIAQLTHRFLVKNEPEWVMFLLEEQNNDKLLNSSA